MNLKETKSAKKTTLCKILFTFCQAEHLCKRTEMIRIQLINLLVLFSYSFAFSQEEERSALLHLQIKNELGEVFKEKILLITKKDTIPITASWDNSFRIDLFPGVSSFVIKNKLFDDYWIDSLFLEKKHTKILDIVWKHKVFIFPNYIREPICRFPVLTDH